nr:uncharacterized protein LOC116769593 [Danaus plexippus plexippus]
MARFRKGFSTIDHIHTLELIIEKYQERSRPLYLAYIDYKKAFDSVSHNYIWETLATQNVENEYIRVVKSIYSHLRFADDLVLISETVKELQHMVELLNQASKVAGLEMNLTKTMVMTNNIKVPIYVDNVPLPYTEKYIYLGKQISFNRQNNYQEIERRAQLTWNKYWSFKEIFKSNMPIKLKTKVMNSCLIPCLTYACQTWKFNKNVKEKIITCQRGMERSMLNIKRINKIRHTKIRNITKATDGLAQALALKWKWAGHIARLQDHRLTRKVSEWRGPVGKRKKGRPCNRWGDEIKPNWMQIAQSRENWLHLEEAFTCRGINDNISTLSTLKEKFGEDDVLSLTSSKERCDSDLESKASSSVSLQKSKLNQLTLDSCVNNIKTFSEKVVDVVTDNGANIVKAVTIAFGKQKHLWCFAHTLNLVAQKPFDEKGGIENTQQLLNIVKDITRYCKQNPNVADALPKAQNDVAVPLKLIQSVCTRWNSIYYQLVRFVKLSNLLAPILLNHPKDPPMLTASQLDSIRDLINILKPMEAVTKEVCVEKFVTSSKIIPIVSCLLKTYSAMKTEMDVGSATKNLILEELSRRFGTMEQVHVLATTTLLDPRGESGFRAAGIVPYNPDHFTEEDFIAAEVLAQPAVIVQDSSMVIPSSTSVNPMTATSSNAIIPAPSTSSATIDPVPLTSSATIDTRLLTSPTVMNATPSTSSGNIQSNIANLLPFPTQTTRERLVKKGQMKQRAKILTSTPVRDSLIEKENKKATKAAKTVKTSKPSKDKNAAPKAKGKQKKKSQIRPKDACCRSLTALRIRHQS